MTSEGGGVGIGARLRAARERRALTVLQAAEKLHVDARVLEALEAENFEPLGADVYVRGHLRRYAELIGESPRELQDLHAAAGPAVRPDLTRIPRVASAPEATRMMMPALLAVIGIAVAGLLWWVLTLQGAKPQTLPPPAAAPVVADAPAPAVQAPVEAAPAAALPPGSQTLNLRFSAPSWVRIADARGQVLLEGMQSAGTTRSVSGAAPLRVVLGNASAVALEVGGHPASLAGFIRRRGDARLLVDAAGAISPSAGRGD